MEKKKDVAFNEMMLGDVTALLIHQMEPDCYYAVFDDLRISRAFSTRKELEDWLKALGYKEI